MKYIDVAIDNNNDNTDLLYTYACPFDDIQVGNKVSVPFARGNRRKDAYVFAISDVPPQGVKNLKEVDLIDEEISLDEPTMAACQWMRRQYLCRYIDAIKCFTPAGSYSKRGKVRRPYKGEKGEVSDPRRLTVEQQQAFDTIKPFLKEQRGKTFLIHGVTSSGKTELYMQVIAQCLRQGKGAVMLVPEISLTKQTIERFIGRFGDENVAVLHSKLSLGERYDEWMRVKGGDVKIVIGARSAVFAPLTDIGVIILDEEHETTYKSDKAPKYDTVEVAIFRAKQCNGIVLLGSATPSMVSYYKSSKGEYEKILLKERYNKAPLPDVEIVDMRKELKNGNRTIFSVALFQQMKDCLKRKRQIILFLNRRGYSSFISCRNCGFVMKCPDCGISLTYHKEGNEAVCHFCGRRETIPKLCPECGSKYIKYFGTGTEKVEEAVREYFPGYVAERLDLDTIKRKDSLNRILNNFKKGRTDILIGTQLVAKGLDFDNVGLVGIVAADITLNLSDYRAPERTFQLITQAAGRAGRGDEPGKVIIQSYHPEHYAITAAAAYDYEGFYERERMMRSLLLYPPYSDLMQIIFSSERLEDAKAASEEAKSRFLSAAGEEGRSYLFEPKPAPLGKINGNYRYQLLIKCTYERGAHYRQIVAEIKRDMNTRKKPSCLMSVDINPFSFL